MKLSNLQKKLKKSEQYLPAEDTFFLADRLKDLCGKSALDIGCGSGYLTDILNSNFQLVVGTDISFNTLCTQNYKTQNAICCHSADALNLQTNHKNLQNNTPYSLGIRPEHIEVCEQQNSDLKVHVDFTEQLGSETYFYCQGEGIKQLIVHHTGQYKINKGEELYLRFKRDSVHLFEENGMSVSKKNI